MGTRYGGIVHCVVILLMLSTPQTGQERVQSVGDSFKSIEVHFDLAAKNLPRHTDKRDEQTYDIEAVNRLLEQTKADTFARIPEDDVPLRIYIDRRFPVQFPNDEDTSLRSVNRALNSVRTLIGTLTRLSTLRLDLTINTEPTNAKFELVLPAGGSIMIATNDRITNLYRGEYDYLVTKTGYKMLRVNGLNLIEQSGTILDCTLQADPGPGDVLPCHLR